MLYVVSFIILFELLCNVIKPYTESLDNNHYYEGYDQNYYSANLYGGSRNAFKKSPIKASCSRAKDEVITSRPLHERTIRRESNAHYSMLDYEICLLHSGRYY
uniref:Uncharacterized protein n=1 Tax=Glossina austeni TaxID=7395 RepID=A0A1A9UG29_GLOAU